MALKRYADAVIFINNTLILDAQEISFGNEQADQKVFNLLEGFAGISVGTEIFMANSSSAVPREGLPLRLDKLASDRTVIECQIFIGDQSVTSKGYVTNVKYSKSLDNAMTCSFEFYGSPSQLS